MLIVVKIILVAFAVFGQSKLFPEHLASTESSLDSLVLPVDKPELVLAQRAMEAEGLCTAAEKMSQSAGKAPVDGTGKHGNAAASDSAKAPEAGEASKEGLATNCF